MGNVAESRSASADARECGRSAGAEHRTEPKSRADWLDIAKGIAIVAVVFGHVLGAHTGLHTLQKVLWTARVPLFFFLAGAVRRSSGGSLREAFAAETRRIVIPYAIFSLLAIMSYFAVSADPLTFEEIGNLLQEALHGTAGPTGMAYNPALWFLTCLVCVFFLGQIIERLGLLGVPALVASLLVAAGVQRSGILAGIMLPWNADIAIIALPFFLAGKLLARRMGERPIQIPSYPILFSLLAVCAAVTAIVVVFNGRVDMNLREYGNIFLFQIGAFAGIIVMLVLSVILRPLRLLVHVGRASLAILATHMIFIQQFTPLTKALAWYGTYLGGHELVGAIVVTAVLTAFGMLAHHTLLRVFPAAIGRQRLNRPKPRAHPGNSDPR